MSVKCRAVVMLHTVFMLIIATSLSASTVSSLVVEGLRLGGRFTHIVKTSWQIHHYLLYNFYYMFKYKGGSLPIGGVIRPRV